MNSPQIGSASHKAHERVAEKVATQYLINLARAEQAEFGTLESLIETFWHEVAASVHEQALKRGAHRINVCRSTLTSLARDILRKQLLANSALRAKLNHIRQIQTNKAIA